MHDAHRHWTVGDAEKAHHPGGPTLWVTECPAEFKWLRAQPAHQGPAKRSDRVGIGLHPGLAESWDMTRATTGSGRTAPRCIAELLDAIQPGDPLGEIGLDGRCGRDSDAWTRQLHALDELLGPEMCPAGGPKRVATLHSVGAQRPLLDALRARPSAHVRPILHWWTGSSTQTEAAATLGCWFSINATMVRNSRAARTRLAAMPRDRVLAETDHPGRGTADAAAEWTRTMRGLARLAPWGENDPEGVGTLLDANWDHLWAGETADRHHPIMAETGRGDA